MVGSVSFSQQDILSMRSAILQKSETLREAHGLQNPSLRSNENGSFQNILNNMAETVSRTSLQAETMTKSYEAGETTNIAELMIARQKASIAFETALQTRNKLVNAYRDIMNMPV